MYDLIIIGAGASGMYLGDLTKNLMNVIILEASNRIGGRILTKKYNNKDINLGAEYLHFNNLDSDPYGHIIMSLLDSKMELLPTKGKSWLSYLNCDWYDKNIISNEDKKNYINNIVKNSNIKEPKNYWEKIIFNRLYFYISNNINRENQLYNANPDLIWKYRNIVESKPLDNDADWYLNGSFENIIKNIDKNSDLCIKFNNYVYEIIYNNDYYSIKVKNNNNIIEYKSKYLAITVPLGCLKQNKINFIPKLPEEIIESINTIGYGHHNKVIVTLAEDYSTENDYFIVKKSNIHWSTYHKNILIGHILGSSCLSKIDIKQNAINDLKEINVNYINIDVIDWRENEFAGNGSYSFLTKLEDKKYVRNFQKPIFNNTLFFCGEAYDLDGFQTVRGAFSSARIVYKKLEKIFIADELLFKECEHLNNILYDFKILDNCHNCDEKLEIWKCLHCNFNGCGRYRNKCSIQHYSKTKHPLVISYPEKNIWCYICNNYINYKVMEINNLKLITNNINSWENNKQKILDSFLTMENNTNFNDIIEIKNNNKLKIIYKLRK